MDNSGMTFFKKEFKLYKKMKISADAEAKECIMESVMMRTLDSLEVDVNVARNRLYTIKGIDDYVLVGYKIALDFFDNKEKEAIYDSRIKADTLLGIFKADKPEGEKIIITYYPFEAGEKITVFDALKGNSAVEITYPLILNMEDSKMTSWNEHWDAISNTKSSEEIVEILSVGEPHFRKHSVEILQDYKSDKFVIYDPACSTGEFLRAIKKNYPNSYAIGHDMDPKMIHIAKEHLDETLCCNAFESPITPASVDVLVLRFLNHFVMSKSDAEQLFKQLVKTVKKDGMIICFGYTPVLMTSDFFETCNLNVVSKSAYDSMKDAIYQYYVMKWN